MQPVTTGKVGMLGVPIRSIHGEGRGSDGAAALDCPAIRAQVRAAYGHGTPDRILGAIVGIDHAES
jgi:hypothetical protein